MVRMPPHCMFCYSYSLYFFLRVQKSDARTIAYLSYGIRDFHTLIGALSRSVRESSMLDAQRWNAGTQVAPEYLNATGLAP